MRASAFGRDRRVALGDLVEAVVHVRPACGELYASRLDQSSIASIAINLEDVTEPLEMGERAFGLVVARVDVGHRGRIGTTPRSIIPGLGSASTGIEDGRGSLVGE